MADYVQYHKPKDNKWGAAPELRALEVFTRKPGKTTQGDRVWLVTSEANPRKYYLQLWFIVDSIERTENPGLQSKISGREGCAFGEQRPRIDIEDWFPDFLTQSGNFGLGFRSIDNPEAVRGLEKIAGIPTASRSH